MKTKHDSIIKNKFHQGQPVEGNKSQEQAQESAPLVLMLRAPIKSTNLEAIIYAQRTWCRSVQALSLLLWSL